MLTENAPADQRTKHPGERVRIGVDLVSEVVDTYRFSARTSAIE
jgi:hypothetical protein